MFFINTTAVWMSSLALLVAKSDLAKKIINIILHLLENNFNIMGPE